MTRLALLTAALLAWCSCAMGDVTPLADYHRAVVQVGQVVAPGESYCGSGTLVCRENGGLVISVGHVFKGSGQCWVDYGDGRRVQAQLVAVDQQLDLSALRTAEPPQDVPCIPVAGPGEFAPQGSQVEFIGYGGGQFRHFTANTVGYKQEPGEPIILDFVSVSGDSGGPVLYDGKLVAVQYGHNGQTCYGTSAGHIRRFLTQYQIPQCQGGNCRPQYRQYQPQVRPIQSAPGAPLVSVPPKPTAPPCKSCECGNLAARVNELEAKIAILVGRAPIPGPKGDKGDKGDPGERGLAGPQGVPGKDASAPVIDTEKLAGEVIKRLPPCKSCECKSQDDSATRPGQPAYFDIKPRTRK